VPTPTSMVAGLRQQEVRAFFRKMNENHARAVTL